MQAKCISNPCNLPYIKTGKTYTIVDQHPTRNDYFEVQGELNIRALYKKEWFVEL